MAELVLEVAYTAVVQQVLVADGIAVAEMIKN